MTIYDDLTPIDEFEAKYGNELAVRRACEVMTAYIGEFSPLSKWTAEGLDIAARYRKHLISLDELVNERGALAERIQQTSKDLPEYRILQAVSSILWFLQYPSWGGGASEVISNFLDLLGEPESKREAIVGLIEEKFGS
jgi:hypothetical protein